MSLHSYSIPNPIDAAVQPVPLAPGDPAIEFQWTDISGETIKLSDYRGQKVLLAFYRFALCPFCNLRLNTLARRHTELSGKGLQIIAFIQSPLEAVHKTAGRHGTPFPVLADYHKEIYARYAVAKRTRGMMRAMFRHPLQALRALLKGYVSLKVQGDPDLMPAEFLINPDGTIHTAHYGKDAGDHLPLLKVEAFLQTMGPMVDDG